MDVSAGSLLGGLFEMLPEQLTDDGIAVVRTHRQVTLLEQYGKMSVIDRRQWAAMEVSILAVSKK